MWYGMKMQTAVMSMVMATAAPALAGDWGFAFNFAQHGRGHGVGVGVMIGRPPVVVAPAPVVVAPAPVVVVPPRPVYVPPVFSTVAERVWVPTVQTLFRDVPVLDPCGRVISYRREPYTVPSGYWTVVQRRVLVREGYWTSAVAGAVTSPAFGEPGQPEPGIDEDHGNVGYEAQPPFNGNGFRPTRGAVPASAIRYRPSTD